MYMADRLQKRHQDFGV